MTSFLRIAAGLLAMAILVPIALAILAPLLPWRWVRLRLSNRFGTVLGWTIMKVSGCRLTFIGRERLSPDRPALYAGNHTSIYDTFLSIWLSPLGTVGVAKKQILYYPFFGLAWLLSGNLSIDRSDPERAKHSLKELAEIVRRQKLHVFMWPEGSRSPDGRLGAFKKGVVHFAIQTRLPIVPVIIQGAHRAWPKASFTLRPEPITVSFLPPIATTHWTEERIEEHLEELRRVFIAALPPDQRPIEPEQKKTTNGVRPSPVEPPRASMEH